MKLTPTTGLLSFGAKSITGLTYSAVPNIWPLGSAGLNYSNVEQLKTFKGGVCVNALLYQWEKNLLNKSGVTDDEWNKQKDKFFKNPSGHAKGCVAISWDKNTLDNNQWKGAIKYEWLYTIGDEILVTYGLWATDHDTRTIYINKRTGENAWKLWKIQNGGLSKKPDFFFGGKKFNPNFATISEAKWSWEEDGHGGEKFSDWSSSYWSSLVTWLPDLKQFEELTKKEQGTWTAR